MEEKKEDKNSELHDKILSVIQTCYDPEIPVNIYELGLIYEINIDDEKNAEILMTLTSPACPVAGTLPGEVEQKIQSIPELKKVKVELVWEPQWAPEMMSEVARYELGMM